MAQFEPPPRRDYLPLLFNLMQQRESRTARDQRSQLDMERRLLLSAAEQGGDVGRLSGLTPVLPASEIEAYKELGKIRKQRLKEEQAQADVGPQATGLASTIGEVEGGRAHPQAITTMLENLIATQGPEFTGRVASRGAADLATLRAAAATTAQKSAGILDRQLLLAEIKQARKEATPEGRMRRRTAEILLKVDEGGKISPKERAFLNEVQRLDPLQAMVRSILGGGTTPETGGLELPGAAEPAEDPKAREKQLRADFAADPETKARKLKIVGTNPDGSLIVADPKGQRFGYQ